MICYNQIELFIYFRSFKKLALFCPPQLATPPVLRQVKMFNQCKKIFFIGKKSASCHNVKNLVFGS